MPSRAGGVTWGRARGVPVDISFQSVTSAVNIYGDLVETSASRVVMAERMPVQRNEFYQAHGAGFRPEVMFVVRSIEYRGERSLVYDSVTYRIIRSYERDDEQTELVCDRLAVS